MADECSNQLANERAVWDVRQFVSMTRPGINEVMFLRIPHPAADAYKRRRTRRETRLVTRSFNLAYYIHFDTRKNST